MAQNTLPAPIKTMIDATNAADSAAFVAAFTEDAYVRDWGREFTSHTGVASWDGSDNIGVGMRFELVSCEPAGKDAYTVQLRATSRRFNGVGTMQITLRDDKIARLEIG